jgi:hypothetical protein
MRGEGRKENPASHRKVLRMPTHTTSSMRRKTPLTDKPTIAPALRAARFDNARAMKRGVERVLEAESVLNWETLETGGRGGYYKGRIQHTGNNKANG